MIGEVLRKDLIFESLKPVSITDKTDDIAEIVRRSEVDYGRLDIMSTHTTLGLILNELTPPLVRDFINASLKKVKEDYRSTWFTEDRVPWFLENGYIAPIPTDEYEHWCGENPNLPVDELDDDYNFGRHLRTVQYTSSSLSIPLEHGLVLGRFQRIGVWENDGRDGLGSSNNPKRTRVLQVRIYPSSGVRFIE